MKKQILLLGLMLSAMTMLGQTKIESDGQRGPDSQWLGTNSSTSNIHRFGNVAIGTDSFTDGLETYKLSVDGKVRATSVKVYTMWADYVFESDYNLPTLAEVEAHIAEKGHLKDIPSAAKVEAEGIELGEMNKLLLQKIEELTLYVIQLNKEIEALKKS